jgi:hypothetical protein
MKGPQSVDGCPTIAAAAAARQVPESTIHALIRELRVRFGLTPAFVNVGRATLPEDLEPDSPLEDDENIESEGLL